ncbi:hypothetical protein [Flexithrix dorotheae]|uniref:hypothetical protein n=1 Tax=Flexithrix dorotheae TaxID=70993 RepID=UPI0003797CDC|nr:hypothetical protein [Flexithrix dorotheae]
MRFFWISFIASFLIQIANGQNQTNNTFTQDFASIFAEGKVQDTIGFMLAPEENLNIKLKQEIKSELGHLIAELKEKKKKYKSDMYYLNKVSKTLFSKYFKTYEPLSTFGETMTSGKYDCLTGTLLFAYVLEHLGYDYNIHETNYHIYLTIPTDKRLILIESTDPYYGFIVNKGTVKTRMAQYQKDNQQLDNQEDVYQPKYKINNTIAIEKLMALQYYNKAIKFYNERNFEKAATNVQKSMVVYDCERNKELLSMIVQNR